MRATNWLTSKRTIRQAMSRPAALRVLGYFPDEDRGVVTVEDDRGRFLRLAFIGDDFAKLERLLTWRRRRRDPVAEMAEADEASSDTRS